MEFLLALTLLANPDSVAVRDIQVAKGETLRTTTVGTGRPVVLIPGIFGGAFSYRKITGPLATQGFRAVVVEPLGFGASSHPKKADYSFEAQSRRVARTLEQMGITNALLIGQGSGTGIAFRLATDRPDLIRGLLSIDGGPTETPATPEMKRLFKLGIWPLKLMMDAPRARHDLRDELTSNSGDTTWVTDEVVERYAAGQINDIGGSLDALYQMSKVKQGTALADRLDGCAVPVLLLIGGAPHRIQVPSEQLALLQRRVQHFSSERVPGAGQYIQEEQPRVVLAAVGRLDRMASTHQAPGER
jgi:pimeloyl-ACP methyl ester carboxylesterase